MFAKNPYTTDRVQLTKLEELQKVRLYQEKGDSQAAESVLKSRAPWVQSVLSNYNPPPEVDMDTVFSDVMSQVYVSLSTFDELKSSLTTYLYRVIRNTYYDSCQEQSLIGSGVAPDGVIDPVEDLSDLVDEVKRTMVREGKHEVNEVSIRVMHMLTKGYDRTRIASALGVPRPQADKVIGAVRAYIAFIIVDRGGSLEPVILDEDLYKLAMEHERQHRSDWGF